MEMNEYQALARRTQNKDLNGHQRLMHALHGLASEVGEIHAIYQKYYQGHNVSREKVMDETGDLLWFIAELCDELEISMDSVARYNIDKLRQRYPSGFDAEHSLHRQR